MPMAIVAISNGIILPLGISYAIGLNPKISGIASGLVGFLQMGFSSMCSSYFGKFFGISSVAMSLEILFLAVIALLTYTFLSSSKYRRSTMVEHN